MSCSHAGEVKAAEEQLVHITLAIAKAREFSENIEVAARSRKQDAEAQQRRQLKSVELLGAEVLSCMARCPCRMWAIVAC